MKILCLTLSLLLFSIIAKATNYDPIINFTDANFKLALLNCQSSSISPTYNNENYTFTPAQSSPIDTNGDGEIQISEALLVKSLVIWAPNGPTGPIHFSNVEELQYFTNLELLKINFTQITTLNVSALSDLKSLDCGYNSYLNNINIGNLTNLIYLSTNSSPVGSINVSGCINLKFLDSDLSQLTSLNVQGAINLEKLICRFNPELTTLNVLNLNNLKYLECSYNGLNNLNIENLSRVC